MIPSGEVGRFVGSSVSVHFGEELAACQRGGVGTNSAHASYQQRGLDRGGMRAVASEKNT